MRATAAWRDGLRRVKDGPAILAGGWALLMLVTVPFALVLHADIAGQLGDSLEAERAASGAPYDWMQEFAAQAAGLATTFGPTVIGFGAVVDNLSDAADREPRPPALVAAAVAYLALWVFLAGGILDRYARRRPIGVHGFFSASGVFFFRFLRLAAIAGIAYALLFGTVHPLLLDDLYADLTRNVTAERTAFVVRLGLYAVFALLLAACHLVFDYAKVRAVVEDRRSIIGALGAAIRFLRRNGGAAAAVYGANVLLLAVVMALYAVVAPGAGGAGPSAWMAFGIGQLYVAARLFVKLSFWASAVALFQGRLAHAGYTARPVPEWPESPAAEALDARPLPTR
jgi:hypothetical protein